MKKQNNVVLPEVCYREKDRNNGWFEGKNFCPPPVVVVTRMQHLGQNKEDLTYPVYLFRFASKGKSAVFIFLMTKSNMA
jgi:hypothetical protein